MSKIDEVISAIQVASLPRKSRVLFSREALEEGSFRAVLERAGVEVDKSLLRDTESLLIQGINAVPLTSNSYPSLLRQIYDPPPVLYYKGVLEAEPLGGYRVGVVGGRRASLESCLFVEELSSCLAEAGVQVISGLALGIDGAAHTGALASKTLGSTIAVLAHGLDIVYPVSHRRLAEQIVASGGCLLSEYPPLSKPLRHHFPERNRIIAGLSQGVLIVEARERSGSLITARCAVEEGRDVFVVPGPVHNPRWSGSLKLLKSGAIPVTEVLDIFDYYDLQAAESLPEATSCDHLELLLKEHGILHVNELMRLTVGKHDIFTTLCELELAGRLRRLPGNFFTLSPKHAVKHR